MKRPLYLGLVAIGILLAAPGAAWIELMDKAFGYRFAQDFRIRR